MSKPNESLYSWHLLNSDWRWSLLHQNNAKMQDASWWKMSPRACLLFALKRSDGPIISAVGVPIQPIYPLASQNCPILMFEMISVLFPTYPRALGFPSTGNHNWLDHCHKSVSQCNPWSPQHPNHPKPGLGPYSFKLHERGRKLFRVQRTSHVSAKGFKSQPTTANCMSLLHNKMHLADYPQKTAGQSPPDDHGMPRDPLRKLNSARTRHPRHHKAIMLWLIFEEDALWGVTYGIGLFISSNTIKWSNTYYMLQSPITVYSPKKLWNHGGSVDPPTIQHPNPLKIRLHRPSWTPGMPSPRWWTW